MAGDVAWQQLGRVRLLEHVTHMSCIWQGRRGDLDGIRMSIYVDICEYAVDKEHEDKKKDKKKHKVSRFNMLQ